MPKVTDEHRERRRQQILDAARTCFIRKGFHQTSMADVLAEAGMSAGAVYGYFRSKEEIVAAIAESVLTSLRSILGPIATQEPVPPLAEAFDTALQAAVEFGFGEERIAELAPMVWAEVPRNPTLRALVQTEYGSVRDMLATLVKAEQRAGHLPDDTKADDIAMVLFGTFMGFLIQKILLPNVERGAYVAGMSALTRAVPADA